MQRWEDDYLKPYQAHKDEHDRVERAARDAQRPQRGQKSAAEKKQDASRRSRENSRATPTHTGSKILNSVDLCTWCRSRLLNRVHPLRSALSRARGGTPKDRANLELESAAIVGLDLT